MTKAKRYGYEPWLTGVGPEYYAYIRECVFVAGLKLLCRGCKHGIGSESDRCLQGICDEAEQLFGRLAGWPNEQ